MLSLPDTEVGQKRSKLEIVAERVNFLPQANSNGTGEGNNAGVHEAAVA